MKEGSAPGAVRQDHNNIKRTARNTLILRLYSGLFFKQLRPYKMLTIPFFELVFSLSFVCNNNILHKLRVFNEPIAVVTKDIKHYIGFHRVL